GLPSRVRTLPRRWISTGRRSRRPRRTESSEPASSAATSLSRVSWRRAKLAQPLANRGTHALAVGAAGDLRHHRRHHLAHLLAFGRAGLLDRRGHQPVELLVGELGRQIALDQLRLEALAGGLLGPPGALI